MPSHWMTSPGVWSYGAAALAFGFFALRLALRWQPGGKPALLLAVAVSTVAAAAGACAFALGATAADWSVARALDLLRSAATLGFLLAFLGVRDSGKGAARGGAWWIALVCIGAVLVVIQIPLGISPPGVQAGGDFSQSMGFVASLAGAIFGLVLVEQCFRRTPGASRWQVRPLLLAFAALLGYDLFLYSDALLFRVLDVDLWGARGVAQALSVPLLVLTLDRTRNWSFELAVSRSVLTGSTVLAATGAYLLIMAGAGFLLRLVGGSWGRALETALIFAALLLLVFVGLSGTFRAKARVFVAKHFFTYRYDYREEWLRFTSTLDSMSASNPAAACITALGELVESPGGAVWLKNSAGQYRQRAHLQFPTVDGVLEATEPLPAFLRRTGWVLEVSDVLSRSASYGHVELPASIANLAAAWLIVPLKTSDDLVGFLVLTHPRVRIDIDWEVRDLLKTAGRQAASFLAYAMATEALLEAQKFDAFHRMSTFVVHDLKNLIAQLQLMLSNAERHRGNPDFQRDMLSTIEHVVGRMHQLMRQLRPDATGGDRPQPVDVAAVAAKAVALHAAPKAGLKVEVDEGILVWAHEDRLERVLAHLVQNAFDASGSNPQVTLRAGHEGSEVLIEVSDRGSGMTAEFLRERLFKPFQTTKETGMGIGAFECQHYVQQVGGRIDVESEPSVGTSVKVRLRAVVDVPGKKSTAV